MDYNDESAMSKINSMVQNFENLCCETCTNKRSNSRKIGYTNFSVHEILKANFGANLSNYESDSDGTYLSESSEFHSSDDETRDPYETHYRNMDYNDSKYQQTREEVQGQYITDDIPKARPFSIFGRFQQQYEEDGYSSSDSEAALDLRIQRKKTPPKINKQLPAWVFCTRYSDRPSAGRRPRKQKNPLARREKRTRIAFNDAQLHQLNIEFDKDQYLSDDRRQKLADDLNLNEANVKIWFQNRRAKLKKDAVLQPLALQLRMEGLYNHKSAIEENDSAR